MPAVPLGGLSFFINISILLIGAGMRYLKKRGYLLSPLRSFLVLFNAKQFDSTLRRVFGFTIMLAIFFFLFASTGISFVNRLKVETNVDLINNFLHLY